MSLSTALSIAQNSLLNTQRQTTVVSRNIANAYNTDYSRRTAVLSSAAPGAYVATIARATDAALRQQSIKALSGWSAQEVMVKSLDWITQSINGADNQSSPTALIGDLQESLQLYSANPSNRTIAETAIEAARDVLRALNEGASAVQSYRADIDRQIASTVSDVNALLAEFKVENDKIINASINGRDALDSYDRRDALLARIAEHIPISTISRENNDLMIITAEGTTLFETIPRKITFEPISGYSATTVGNRISIDGVPISATSGANTTASGSLAALVQVRDTVTTEAQVYLDEIARGLINAFAETNPSDASDVRPGLFTWPGAPAMPASGTLIDGLAAAITLNAAIDPRQGGDPTKLRDGVNFNYNPDGNASYTGQLIRLTATLDEPQDFVRGGTISLAGFSSNAINWLESERKIAASASEIKSALMMRTEEALSNYSKVNVDEEMALMLELEQSYAASAKMMQMIDEMLKTLLSIVR